VARAASVPGGASGCARRSGSTNEEAAAVVAAQTLSRQFAQRSHDRWANWEVTRGAFPREWREANFRFDTLTYLTAGELDAVGEEMLAIIDRYADRIDRAKRPEGAYPVAISGHGHPLEPSPSGN